MNETAAQQSSLTLANVMTRLSTISQGDVISLGAVNIVGVGHSAAWNSTAQHEGLAEIEPGEEVWSLSIESDVGWYVDRALSSRMPRQVRSIPGLASPGLRSEVAAILPTSG
jgi:hypothetical protein